MTSIPTTADLLRLLREDPDFRDEVRRLVLTQELIELPERFARFEAYVERQFAEIRSDIARLDEGQAQMRGDIAEMRGDIAREYERHWRIERSGVRTPGRACLRQLCQYGLSTAQWTRPAPEPAAFKRRFRG